MPLNLGTKLGPYEIVAPIGAGGMGEVYKAKDTRLDRTVAIKVLPSHLADNPDLKQRFEREARAVSSLNHPHICTLHDIGEQDGTDFLVMEYIEGESLADRLKKGALPFDQALRHGIEIAGALDKAHRQGVVHRDLKPGNIMLTKSGAKLLDFGLAKLKASETGQEADVLSALPTEQKPLTEKGSILGTFQYMAPEQLEVKDVDARTDIFAFGSVLYEMVTGKRAFEGQSQASLIAAILERDPPPVSELQSLSPPILDRLVVRCLAKSPEVRWHSAHDLHDELVWCVESDIQANAAAGRRAGRPGLAMASALLLGALFGILMWNAIRTETPSPNFVSRFTLQVPPEQQPVGLTALSRNGRYLAYASSQGMYLRSMDRLEAKVIPGTEGAEYPFFSPDSRWVGYFVRGSIFKVLAGGGPPIRIAGAPAIASGATWGPDDTIITGSVSGGLIKISVEDGSATKLTVLATEQGEQSHRSPNVLPQDKRVFFTIVTTEGPVNAVASLETGEYRKLFPGSAPHYLPTGHLVYAQEGSLFAVAFDAESLEPTDTPVPVLDGVFTQPWGNGEVVHYSISDTGTLMYLAGGRGALDGLGRLVWVSRSGEVTPFTEEQREYMYPRFSPDEKTLAVSMQTEDGRSLWLHDVDRGVSMRFTFDGTHYISYWTPDSHHLTFHSDHAGQGIFWKPIEGSGPQEELSVREQFQWPGTWSPDGTVLAYTEVSPLTSGDIWILPGDGETEPFPFINSTFDERAPAFSPDGRFLAYISDESGQYEVYVQSYPTPDTKHLVSTDGGTEPVWSPNGKELFYRHGNDLRVVAVELDGPTLTLGRPTTLLEAAFRRTYLGVPTYDVSENGQRFIMVEQGGDSTPKEITVVLNWTEELKRLVPTEN